ncbi:MAG: phosphate/phosphite/phosphonate ABC transporter substrate-binding protein [Calditerrivibrio sp.]|uniref:phosphate/phosphite/phosphonate ABC transporter substrate-binding protein n=1 Tax=Calditerrivibrio sp. TaxID=2792612 RepID=UPI003D0BA021
MLYKNIFLVIMMIIFVPFLIYSEISFAPIQMETADREYEKWKPFMDLLEKETGEKVVFKHAKSSNELIEMIAKNQAHLAYLCSLTYVMTKQRNNDIYPLYAINVSSGGSKYRCVLFKSGDKKLSVKNLNGARYALVSPYATCGFLSMNYIYQKYTGKQLTVERFVYLDSHNSVVEHVIAGDFDFGGTNSIVFEKYKALGIEKVDETPDLPGFAIVVNRKLIGDEKLNRLKKIIKNIFEHEEIKRVSPFGISSATDTDYDIIRKMMPVKIPMEGNLSAKDIR